MNPPDSDAFEAAYVRRLYHLSKQLEQLARMCRGTLTTERLAEVWAAQHRVHQTARVGPQPKPSKIPDSV